MNAVRATKIETAEPLISSVTIVPDTRAKKSRGAKIKGWLKRLGSRQDLTISEFERLESKKTRHRMLRGGMM